MKKLGIGCFSVFCLAILCFVVWVNRPLIQDPGFVSELVQGVETRFAARQVLARDTNKNMFLDKTFVGYWGREGKERIVGSSVEKVVVSFNETFSTASSTEAVDHRVLLDSKEPGTIKIKDDFEELLPEILRVIDKPYFVAPEPELSADATLPNLIALRELSQALSGYAEILAVENRSNESIPVILSIFKLAERTERNETLLAAMMSVALGQIGGDALSKVLPPDADLSAEEWKSLSEQLLLVVPDKDQMFRAMAIEFYIMDKALVDFATGNSQSLGTKGLTHSVPGLMSRERRILTNTHMTILQQLKKNHTYPVTHQVLTLTSFLKGRVGFMSSILVPSFEKGHSRLRVNRQRMLLVALGTGVLAFKKEKGEYPQALEQLAELGLQLDTVEQWNDPVVIYEPTTDGGRRLKLALAPEDLGFASRDSVLTTSRPWVKVIDLTLVVDL